VVRAVGRAVGLRHRPMAPRYIDTRDALLDAGEQVVADHGLAGLSVNLVVAEARVAKGTFYVHFADRSAFVDAMHQRFHERLRQHILMATDGLDPGSELLARATSTYLDLALANRAVKALAIEARTDPELSAPIIQRSAALGALAEPSFKALGWQSPRIAARLYQAMVSEASLMELEAGKRLPAARRSLTEWLSG
jgi:TetR/AcrR family transcriptional regulator, transcriptional repressor for nem operon